MARTESTMQELGISAPDFALQDVVTNRLVKRDDYHGKKALLVMFLCEHCPFVRHVEAQLAQLGRDYRDTRVGIVAICSNDAVQYPSDGPEGMAAQARRLGFSFPYLYDESQQVAKAYGAVCTPDFGVYDEHFRLRYRGQLDGSRPGNEVAVTGIDLRRALDALVADQPIPGPQLPSLGCNIKWK